MIKSARKAAEAERRDLSLKAAITRSTAWREASSDDQRLIWHAVNGSVEAEYGGAASEVSAWFYDESREFGGEDALFPDGFDHIVHHLAGGLDIRLSAPVAAIAPQGRGVAVTVRGGDVLIADQVVVSVPLGVLKSGDLAFREPLSRDRQRAIAGIGMGLLNKCWLRFDRVAWPGNVDWIEWVGPKTGRGRSG